MANVNEDVLRAFSLKRFIASIGDNLLEINDGIPAVRDERYFSALDDEVLTACVESFFWLLTGIELAYFPESANSFIQTLAGILNKEIYETEGREFPYWTEDFIHNSEMTLLMSIYYKPTEKSRSENFSFLGKFQAALFASEAFRSPLIDQLLRQLRSKSHVLLDKPIARCDMDEVYSALMQADSDKVTVASLFAGFIELIAVLQIYSDIFGRPREVGSIGRGSKAFKVGMTVGWRLNLSDFYTAKRLKKLVGNFLALVEATRRDNEEIATWQFSDTVEHLNGLFDFWQLFSETVTSTPRFSSTISADYIARFVLPLAASSSTRRTETDPEEHQADSEAS